MKKSQMKLFFMALAEYLKITQEFLDVVSDTEKKGLKWQEIQDPNAWTQLFSEMIQNKSKEDYLKVMEIIYLLGKLQSINIYELSYEERKELSREIKNASRILIKVFKE